MTKLAPKLTGEGKVMQITVEARVDDEALAALWKMLGVAVVVTYQPQQASLDDLIPEQER